MLRPLASAARRTHKTAAAPGSRLEKLRESMPPPPPPLLAEVQRKVVVLSGKGGVGKSTLAAQMAFSLAAMGHKVGLLDVDICGPSIPHLVGLRGNRVNQKDGLMAPVVLNEPRSGGSLSVMSIGFLLNSESDPVVLRGPRKDATIRQFLSGVAWGALDFLVIDTPPGTSDEHLSLVQALGKVLTPDDGAVVVSTPQELALADVRKELAWCAQSSLRVLGVVENMAPLRTRLDALRFFDGSSGADATESTLALLRERCPELLEDVHAAVDVFPAGGEGGGTEGMAAQFGVPFLGRVPLDTTITQASERGLPSTSVPAIAELVSRLRVATRMESRTPPPPPT